MSSSRVTDGAGAGPLVQTGEVSEPLPYLGENFPPKRTKK
jgi:hypothetical protein